MQRLRRWPGCRVGIVGAIDAKVAAMGPCVATGCPNGSVSLARGVQSDHVGMEVRSDVCRLSAASLVAEQCKMSSTRRRPDFEFCIHLVPSEVTTKSLYFVPVWE